MNGASCSIVALYRQDHRFTAQKALGFIEVNKEFLVISFGGDKKTWSEAYMMLGTH